MRKFLYFLIFVLFITSVTASLNDSLAYYFTLDESGTPIDTIGNITTISKSGTPTFLADCKINGCYEMTTGDNSDGVLGIIDRDYTGDEYTFIIWANITNDDIDNGILSFGAQISGDRVIMATDLSGGGTIGFCDAAGSLSIPGDCCYFSTTVLNNNYTHYSIKWNGTNDNIKLFINGVLDNTCNKPGVTSSGFKTQFEIGNQYNFTQSMDGSIDEVYIYEVALSDALINEHFNRTNTGEQYPFTTGDNSPPDITFSTQIPNDITTTNAMEQVFINYSIIDVSGINNSTVSLNITVSGNIYINGTLSNLDNFPLNYSNINGDIYDFNVSDQYVYPAIYNINPSIMDIEPHLNDTLSIANQAVKHTYLNFSCEKNQTLIEYMFINSSSASILQHYYCNSSYSSGNYISSNNCGLVHQEQLTPAFNHTHSIYSGHKIAEIKVEDNQIGGVGCTESVSIITRCINADCRYFYISNVSRINALQDTNNNGVGWSNIAGTLDAHIHQMNTNESFNYRVSACDILGLCTDSVLRTDYYNLTVFPPSPVNIINPLGGNIYNLSISISYTESIPSVGLGIYGYNLSYRRVGTTIDTVIDQINTTTYDWDISNLADSNYTITVRAIDSTFNFEDSTSEVFIISNPLSTTDQLLTSLLSEQQETNSLLSTLVEVFDMLGILLIYIGLLYIAFKFDKLLILTLGIGLGFFSGLYYIVQFNISGDINFIKTGVGLILLVVNTIYFTKLFILYKNNRNEKQEE